MSKPCCGTCLYSIYDDQQGYECTNGDSEYCADYVEYSHCCEDYEEKDGINDD